jgi:SAM-dependent methyltransferase
MKNRRSNRDTTWQAGHSGAVVYIGRHWRVLDVGSGDCPHPRADVLVDKFNGPSQHRCGRALSRDGRPIVIADGCALPFADAAFDFVIASHIAEHIEDPESFCRELARVAKRGYLETPGTLSDLLLGEEFHVWSVRRKGGELVFTPLLKPRGKIGRLAAGTFYRLFYLGQRRSKPTWSPSIMKVPVLGSPAWRFTALLKSLWKSSLARRWTYTCFSFEGPFRVRTQSGSTR